MLTAQSFRQLPLEEQLEKTTTDFYNWAIWNYENLNIKREDLNNKIKTNKLKELSKKLKEFDYTFHYSDDGRAYRKGKAQEDEITKLYKEIGAEGLKMYRDFLKSKGMMEGQNEKGVYDYQRYYHSKMKKWGIKDIDELSPEDKKYIKEKVNQNRQTMSGFVRSRLFDRTELRSEDNLF